VWIWGGGRKWGWLKCEKIEGVCDRGLNEGLGGGGWSWRGNENGGGGNDMVVTAEGSVAWD